MKIGGGFSSFFVPDSLLLSWGVKTAKGLAARRGDRGAGAVVTAAVGGGVTRLLGPGTGEGGRARELSEEFLEGGGLGGGVGMV